jgi:ATP-dependent DNA helicase RecG
MGIIADVNLLYKGEIEYLQIVVDKYPSLISFRGKYYYRSGSTMREITGKELERALLKTQGRTWDGVPLPKLSVTDLKQDAIQLFKDKAVKRGRLTKEEVSVSDDILMDNLHLIDEDGYLVRAAMLAFYKDPEKWVTGAYVKIGYFGKSDSDLVYQDEVHGSLIEQVDKTVDLVYTKYMKALIDYEGIQRVEQFMFHKDAFREILLNAIVHKDYSSCNPIQISVYEDKIYIWNDGEMPEELDSTDKLFLKHASKPYNPKLANVFFKSGMIEAWGRGFEKIKEACALYEGSLPEYEISASGIMVLCKACDRYLELLSGKEKVDSIISDERIMSEKVSELKKEPIIKIVNYLKENEDITTAKGMEITGKSEAQVRRYLKVLCDLEIIKSTRTTKGNVYVKVN